MNYCDDNYREHVKSECENCKYYYIARFHQGGDVVVIPFCDRHKASVNKSGTCDAWVEKKV